MTPACKVRKGQLAVIKGVTVRVTQREKWSPKSVRIYFEDAGNGLPHEPFGTQLLPVKWISFGLNEPIHIL